MLNDYVLKGNKVIMNRH